jgi:hypothetical protein
MAFINYTDWVPTPAPLTSGSTIQSFTDPTGEVWVAKNGVNGGQWLKARDVIYTRLTKTAAYTFPTTAGPVFPWDSVVRDVYGCFSGASGYAFTCPVAGLYRVDAMLCVTFTAVNQSLGIYLSGTNLKFRTNIVSPSASNTYAHLHDASYYNAGDTGLIQASTSVALALYPGSSDNYISFQYVGTG